MDIKAGLAHRSSRPGRPGSQHDDDANVESAAEVDHPLKGQFEFAIAASLDDLEACFTLLHNAYVASGFMAPHPSGIRVTPHHALPTTTTLGAKVDGKAVGTLSLVRKGVFGLPMQSVFDIESVRSRPGQITQISSLAVHPEWRRKAYSILIPLMKFMHDYCLRQFDTRHLVIAVNPAHINMYESVMVFRRLTEHSVDRYDFVNGAPAVGATLDLHELPELYERVHGHRRGRQNLIQFFLHSELVEARFPARPWNTTNDPVMTPRLLDHFFNRRTQVFDELDERRIRLLHSIYFEAEWAEILPALPLSFSAVHPLRREPRYSMNCPGVLRLAGALDPDVFDVVVIDVSRHGCQALTVGPLELGSTGTLRVELGSGVISLVGATVVRQSGSHLGMKYSFRIEQPDANWERFVNWLPGVHVEAAFPPATSTA